jgi:dTMP kinase
MHIVIEGPDYSGKSTVSERLYAASVQCPGISTSFKMHQPGDTRLGEGLRSLLKDKDVRIDGKSTQLLLTAADHHEFVYQRLMGMYHFMRQKGKRVCLIQDRHSGISGYAYQVVANGADPKLFRQLYTINANIRKFQVPDRVYLLIPSLDTIRARMVTRGTPKDRYENLDYLAKVLKGYNAVAEKGILPRRIYKVINANLSQDTVYKLILSDMMKQGPELRHLADYAIANLTLVGK